MYLLISLRLDQPFNASLTPNQRQIKARSAQVRSKAFSIGILYGGLFILLWKPFRVFKF